MNKDFEHCIKVLNSYKNEFKLEMQDYNLKTYLLYFFSFLEVNFKSFIEQLWSENCYKNQIQEYIETKLKKNKRISGLDELFRQFSCFYPFRDITVKLNMIEDDQVGLMLDKKEYRFTGFIKEITFYRNKLVHYLELVPQLDSWKKIKIFEESIIKLYNLINSIYKIN